MDKIAVIGIGRLGLCFALQLEKAGYDVLGIDNRLGYVQSINNKELRSSEPGVENALQTCRHLKASDQLEALLDFPAQIIFIALATPTDELGGYDHSHVNDLLTSLYALRLSWPRKDIVIMCTTLPGYCDAKATEALGYDCF